MSEYRPIIIDYPLCCRGGIIGSYTTPTVIDKDCRIKKEIFLEEGKLDTILEAYFIENLDLFRGTAALRFYAGNYEGEIVVRKYGDTYVVERSYLIYENRKKEFLLQINSLPVSARKLYETIKTFVLDENERKARVIANTVSRLIPDEKLRKIVRYAFR